MEIIIKNDYKSPEENSIEIVERKGLGHPDTLADKLAELCSKTYARYCYKNFGCVLHYNFDKLYIGGGKFIYQDNKIIKENKIRIELNGRASNTMNGKKIDIDGLLTPVIKKYIKSIIPRIDVENDLYIKINCTQNSKRDNWYTPKSIEDIPDAKEVFASDTSLCVAHGGMTFVEKIAMEVENFFWNYDTEAFPTPKFSDIGQDIKVMVSRIENNISVTVCMPVYKDIYETQEEYEEIVMKYEKLLEKVISKIKNLNNYTYKVDINKLPSGSYRNYSLLKGSCIECGEEGVVGRGNNSQGLITAFRNHTVEASSGKNVRYHTGKVVDFMARQAVKRIYNELDINCSLYALTRNRNSLYRPYVFYLSVDSETKNEKIRKIINEEFNSDYIEKILNDEKVV